jgi:hypothetical protein
MLFVIITSVLQKMYRWATIYVTNVNSEIMRQDKFFHKCACVSIWLLVFLYKHTKCPMQVIHVLHPIHQILNQQLVCKIRISSQYSPDIGPYSHTATRLQHCSPSVVWRPVSSNTPVLLHEGGSSCVAGRNIAFMFRALFVLSTA